MSGAAARVEATLVNSIHGINSWKETCRANSLKKYIASMIKGSENRENL